MVNQHSQRTLVLGSPRLLSVHVVQIKICEERYAANDPDSGRKTIIEVGGVIPSKTHVEDVTKK